MESENKNNGLIKDNPIVNAKFPHKISELIPSILYILDLATLKNVYINKEAFLVLGYTTEEAIDFDKNIVLDKIHPDDHQSFLNHIEKLKKINKEEVLVFEFRLKSAKGKWLWFQSRDTVYDLNADGSASQIIGTAIDITNQKEVEQKLKKDQEQLREAQTITKLGYYTYNFITGKGSGSSIFLQVFGIDEGINLDYSLWIELVHPDFKEKFSQLIDETIAKKSPSFEMDYKIVNLKTKKEKWVRGLGKLIYNDKNEAAEMFGTVQDITQQKEVSEKLAQSNEKLDNIISHSSSLFYSHTPEGYLTYLSPKSKEFLGCEPEIAMHRWQEFITDNPINELGIAITTEAINTGKKQPQYTLELKTMDGRIIRVLVDESPVVKNGKTIAIVGSLTDITKKKELEEKLKESEEKLRLVIESSPVGIVLYTPDGNAFLYNRRFLELFGYKKDEIPTVEAWFTKAYPDINYREAISKEWEVHINEYFSGGPFTSFEADVTCNDGSVKNIEFGFGAIEGLHITTFVDVTERNTILKEVERNKGLLCENEKLSKTGAWEFDVAAQESFWTEGLYRIHGMDNTAVKDKITESLKCYSKEDGEKVLKAFKSSIEKGEEYDLVLPFTSLEGNKKWVRTITRAINKDGKIDKVIGSLMDITEQVKHETQLKELNATKDKLFSIVSHDLKNPIGAIINLAGIALENIDEAPTELLKKYLDIINKSGQRSIDLLNNLLEWSAVNTGRISVFPTSLKLHSCIEGIGELFKSQMHNKNITFKNSIPENFTIQADEKLLNTVLRNLISNAIKFTPEKGAIKLDVKKSESKNIISVSDTGIGIDKNDIDKLFDSNTFFSKDGTNKEKGSGLGLILCHEFVKMHNGQIKVNSEQGKGTTFEIMLPIAG